MKRTINESQLKAIVKESVRRTLNEYAEGNEMYAIHEYSPTPKGVINGIVSEVGYLDEFKEKVRKCLINNDKKGADYFWRQMGYSIGCIKENAEILQGMIEDYYKEHVDDEEL